MNTPIILDANTNFNLSGNATLDVTGSISSASVYSLNVGNSLYPVGQTALILSGNNTYTGGTSIGYGAALQIGAGGSTGTLGTGNISDNGTLTFNRSGYLTVNGAISGAGGVTQIGSGTTILTGSDTYSGSTIISLGTLQIGNGSSSASLNINSPITDNGNLVIDGSAIATLANVSGSGSVNIIQAGNYSETLGRGSTYTGVTTISAGGTMGVVALANGGMASDIGASSSLASNLVLNGGTLAFTGSPSGTTVSSDRLFTLGVDSGSTINNNNTDTLFSTEGSLNLTNTGALGLSGSGPRTLALYGTAQVTGLVTANTLASVIGDGVGGPTSVYSYTVDSSWALNGQNTYTGTTTIYTGVLSVNTLANGGSASRIGASSNLASNLIIENGGTLMYTGSGASTDRLFQLNYNGGSIDSSGTGAVSFTNSGAIGLNGSNETLTLTGSNTNKNIFAPTLANGTSSVIYGYGSELVKSGTGTWDIVGTNTYSGGTQINAGTLMIGSNSALGTGPIYLAGGATLAAGLQSGLNAQLGGLTVGPGTAYLDFGAGNNGNTFSFSYSGANNWSGTLDILNDPSGDTLYIDGLTANQLADIFFVNPDGRTGTFAATMSGSRITYVGAASAPEPSALALLLPFGPIAILVSRRRRQCARVC